MKPLRSSCYNIYLKSPREGYAYLVHGYSGAIDVVTEAVSHFLKTTRIVTQEAIDQGKLAITKEDVELLKERGYLTIKTPKEEREHVWKFADVLHRMAKRRSSFLFLVAYDCNFRCPYCYENDISNKGRGWSKRVFSKKMVDRAYQTMSEIQPNREMHLNSITLYGGEPLLARNYDIVTYIVEEGLKRNYTFGAVTNGYDLDHYIDLVGPGKIEWLQITVDGPPETHNRRRTHYRDGSSFEKIMHNVENVLRRGVKVSVRINTDTKVLSELPKVMDIFKERGFLDNTLFTVYSALVTGEEDSISCNTVMTDNPTVVKQPMAPDTKNAVDINDLDEQEKDLYFGGPDAQYIDFEKEEQLFQDFLAGEPSIKFHYDFDVNSKGVESVEKLERVEYVKQFYGRRTGLEMQNIGCQDFGLKNTIENVLRGRGLMKYRSIFCGAQSGMIIFDPYGDLYTCWEHVGKVEHKIGTYEEKLKWIESEVEKWFGKNISKVPACSRCKYALFCGGGCTIMAVNEGKGFRSSYCDGYPGTFHVVAAEAIAKYFKEKSGETSESTVTPTAAYEQRV